MVLRTKNISNWNNFSCFCSNIGVSYVTRICVAITRYILNRHHHQRTSFFALVLVWFCCIHSNFGNPDNCGHVSNFTDLHNQCLKNVSCLNLTNIHNMTSDFCKFQPKVFQNSRYSISNVPANSTCELIKKIFNEEKEVKAYHDRFVNIIDRYEPCAVLYDKKIYEKCPICKDSYKQWLCSVNFNNATTCELAEKVCLYCPAIEQADGYGGYPIFECGVNRSCSVP